MRFIFTTLQNLPIRQANSRILIFIEANDAVDAKAGDIYLAQLERREDDKIWAKPFKKMDTALGSLVGVVADKGDKYLITPTNRKLKSTYLISKVHVSIPLKTDDLVTFRKIEKTENIEIIENLGSADDVRNVSLIAIHENGIRTEFPKEAVADAESAEIPELGRRTDLRDIALVTIDGEDARDFDDAVFVEPCKLADDEAGWRLIVAIADVSYYVTPDSNLDREAKKRGNSTYFPDRVVPMLPEALSNGLCSLNPHEDRACMALEMLIDNHGRLRSKKIMRALMRSKQRLTYTQVFAFLQGQEDEKTAPLKNEIKNMQSLYKILRRARDKRGALDIHGTEQKIIFGTNGKIEKVAVKEQNQANELIEEFMVLSNVAVAELLEEKGAPCIYRIHDRPPMERIQSMKTFLSGFGYRVPEGDKVRSSQLNDILKQADGKPESFVVNETVLRSQSPAMYSGDNIGHFGLALDRYAHFTSPIRRYADLFVHRSLIRAYKLGNDGLTDKEISAMHITASDISETERLSVRSERQAMSRLTAVYLSQQEGHEFNAIISGVSDAGVFVRLPQYGAEGIIPIRLLHNDYYIYDEPAQRLVGRRSGRIYQLMAPIKVLLVELNALTDNIVFEPADDAGAALEGFNYKLPQGVKFGAKGASRDRDDRGPSRHKRRDSTRREKERDHETSRFKDKKRPDKGKKR